MQLYILSQAIVKDRREWDSPQQSEFSHRKRSCSEVAVWKGWWLSCVHMATYGKQLSGESYCVSVGPGMLRTTAIAVL